MLEKLRSGEPLTAKEKQIHDQGLVTVLRQIHDELDEAVLEAYGWGDLAVETQDGKIQDARKEEEIENKRSAKHSSLVSCVLPSSVLLTRLVALNHERAAEEKRGLIRWLRPEYQNPGKPSDAPTPPLQADLAGTETSSQSPIPNLQSTLPWPDRLPEQVAILRKLIGSGDRNVAAPYDAESLSAHFGRKNQKRTDQIEGILETLKGLGQL